MISSGSREPSFEGKELDELGNHMQAPLYLQKISFKALERPSQAQYILRHFLRLLLLHVTGAMLFVEMRTADGEGCSSLLQAYSHQGLLDDYAEWRRVLSESFASEFVPLSQVSRPFWPTCEPRIYSRSGMSTKSMCQRY